MKTQALWGELRSEAKRFSTRKREPHFVAGYYATGDEPWALYLLPPESALPSRLLFVQKLAGTITTHWVL